MVRDIIVTVLVSVDDSQHRMHGMLVAYILLFFLFHDIYHDEDVPSVLVNWFIPDGDGPNEATGMWVIKPEYEGRAQTVEVIHLNTIS